MKKFFTLIFCLVSLGASAQFQIPNSDFERWDTETYNETTGDAPVAWNSFLQGSGGLQNAAAANQLSKSNDIRPGSNGIYSAKIIDRYINYVIVKSYAQGNLTTGCINMGSATANNPGKSATDNNSKRGNETIMSGSGNYNWTNIDDTTYNAKFTGFPDAMHVWVKFYSPTSSYRAKATTVLHTNGYYQDPLPKTDDCVGDLVGTAANTSIAPDANNWQELTIPFSYPNGTTTRPSFALVTFSTNATPGTGTGSDYMLIDDLEFIYNSSLSDLKFNETTVHGFAKDNYNYYVAGNYTDGCITYTKDCIGGEATESWNETTGVYTITVKGDDWSETNLNEHTYTVTFVDCIIEDGVTDIESLIGTSESKILLKRNFKAGWNTICLPFGSAKSYLGEGAEVYKLTTSSTNSDVITFTNNGTAALMANNPYLIYLPTAISNIVYTGRSITSTTIKTIAHNNWIFAGNYTQNMSMEGKWGVVNEGGKVRKGGSSSTLKGTRAYFTNKNNTAGVNEMRFIIDGEETNITEIDGEPLSYDVYNLNGMLVRKNATDLNGLRKGIYIVNGKKYIVK